MNFMCHKVNRLRALAAASTMLLVILVATAPVLVFAQTRPILFPTASTFVPDAFNQHHAPILAMASGDFNGDGKLDLVASDGTDISVALGKGDGTFQPSIPVVQLPGSNSVGSLVVGDFNGDHIPDIAAWGTSNAGGMNTGVLIIYLGNGTGNFSETNTYTTTQLNAQPGLTSADLTVGDFNGDGKLDLAGIDEFDGAFVFIGNGDGSFKPAVNYPIGILGGGSGQGLVAADLNGDHKADLAVSVNNGVSILMNNGNGTFAAPANYAASVGGQSASGIAVADINHDGKLDVVVTNTNGLVNIFLNQGTGTFTASGSVSDAVTGTRMVALADLNGDKKLDIVEGDAYGYVTTFIGNGAGAFAAGTGYPMTMANSAVSNLITGDFNGDGVQDIAISNGGGGQVNILLGRGDGTFRMNIAYGLSGSANAGHNLVTADFNGDGFPDVAYSYLCCNSGGFAVMLGSSHGALATPVTVNAGSCTANLVEWIAAGDVNGDGKPDVVATLINSGGSGCQSNTVAVMTGKGNGTFNNPVYYSTGSTAQSGEVFLADVSGDGKLDIVTSNADGTISALKNKGNGTFNAGVLNTGMTSINANFNNIAIADFNGDGKADIAVSTGGVQNSVWVLPGNGDGTFKAPIATGTGYFPNALVAGDFNHDGKVDLAVETGDCNAGENNGNVGFGILIGKGNGTFAPKAENCVGGSFVENPVAADFNGDGKLDLFIPMFTYSEGSCQFDGCGSWQFGPALLQGKGDGTFTRVAGTFYVGNPTLGVVTADFNADGMTDIAVLDNDNITGNNGSFTSFVTVMKNATQQVSVSPLTQNFGMVTVGAKKAATVILTNNQSTALSITSLTLGGTNASDFTETSNCGTSRKPGWDCTVTVTFSPAATGARTATLSIVDGAGTQVVSLNGTGK